MPVQSRRLSLLAAATALAFMPASPAWADAGKATTEGQCVQLPFLKLSPDGGRLSLTNQVNPHDQAKPGVRQLYGSVQRVNSKRGLRHLPVASSAGA